jgi:hypothetical protein
MKNNNLSKLIKFLGNLIKPKEIPKNKIRPNHQPSWMYRNE